MTSAESAIETGSANRSATTTWLLLGVTTVSFVVFCAAFVPRLTNVHFGDVEFSGWSGPMGSRLLRGERPYVDFTLPIPPGSFVLLALIEKIAGGPLLLHELWLNAVIHALLGLLAYAIAAPFTSRMNAILVAASTLVALTYLNKECAYDHTAQLCCWGSVALGVRAVFSERSPSRRWWWIATGAAAALTMGFKQSTGLGAVLAWPSALGYLALVERISRDRREARALGRDAWHLAGGTLLGTAAVWLLLVGLGTSVGAFVTAVFVDGSRLKGGSARLLLNVWGYVSSYAVFPTSLGIILVMVLAGARIAQKDGFHLGREPDRRSDLERWGWVVGVAVMATFGGAALLLRSKMLPLGREVTLHIDQLKQIPGIGLVFGVAFGLAHVRRGSGPRNAEGPLDPDRVGHAFNALLLVSLSCTILHNTSAPEFRPFYDNNVVIPVAFLFLYVAIDRTDTRFLKPLVLALVLASLFGNKLQRALEAKTPVGRHTHWAGLRVSKRGADILEAARRVRALTGPKDTVLVLPEDVQLAALIGRPRPALRGAIVFVDQYPRRVLVEDIGRLEREPPKVIVIHPQQPQQWMRFYRIWAADSPAEKVLRHVLMRLIPDRYARDSSYPTSFHGERGRLDIWVRKR